MLATALFLLQATVQSPRLIESSGVAVSRAHPVCYGRTTTRVDRSAWRTGLEIGGEAIDCLDDSTFVLTSEAGRSRPGTIDTVNCRLSREQPAQ